MVEKSKRVAFIVSSRDFRDEEYFIPKENLEKRGAEIYTFSNNKGMILGADGGEGEAEKELSELNPKNYSAIVFIGGPGALKFLDNEESYRIAQKTVAEDKLLAAICISPVILAKAGVLRGVKATVFSSSMEREPVRILKDNGALHREDDVIKDGKIITANGPGAVEQFSREIEKALSL